MPLSRSSSAIQERGRSLAPGNAFSILPQDSIYGFTKISYREFLGNLEGLQDLIAYKK
jgi:hypothetical protein